MHYAYITEVEHYSPFEPTVNPYLPIVNYVENIMVMEENMAQTLNTWTYYIFHPHVCCGYI